MHKCQGGSSSVCHKKMNNSLLDSPNQDASNGGRFISLASVEEKLLAFYCLETFNNYLLSIDARNMNLLPFDAS